jgi:hypothetical protein
MKAYAKSFSSFYSQGYIHFKIDKLMGNYSFVPIWGQSPTTKRILLMEVFHRTDKKSLSMSRMLEKNGKTKSRLYYAIFVLSDGIFYIDFTNPEMWEQYKNDEGHMRYRPTFHNMINENKEFKVPIKYLQRLNNDIVNEIFNEL